jgi:hypothetical protein
LPAQRAVSASSASRIASRCRLATRTSFSPIANPPPLIVAQGGAGGKRGLIERRPCEFHSPPERTYCSISCSNRAGHHRRREGEDAPRPLLLESLREALKDRPHTAGNIADAAERVGADEREILALMEETR